MNIVLNIIMLLAFIVIAVNIATTISPRFRRWVYLNDRS